ncbi:MmgE/PrpD family protein [Paragemmobacter ruber]|uniref:MmgE/PrpD family protein n=1 Tax=Paragemmobacter ruber TaxID=1985673 RepID=A0ABW9Y523_9RHOB|nr:MmgE/PrpD family protein [Rhodobacter ruber]NBE07181.1 MmgE/PrpD family protein [Rhodobacter ruber]
MSCPQTARVADHIATALATPLPPEVEEKARLHLLDTLAAILSGGHLPAGIAGARLARRLGGPAEALVIGSDTLAGAPQAALANAMAAHADETDDSHVGGRFHPGCAIVPAALAMAETQGAGGTALLRAITLGYDIGARAVMALGVRSADTARFSTHTIGGNFGATAAAAALAGLGTRGVMHALSYAVQQTSGVPYWRRDADHIEKAFDFGGLGARNGVMAALMVQEGWTAVEGVLTGTPSYLSAFAEMPQPDALTDGLGTRYEIMGAAIKKWCVGSPIQAALDSVIALIEAHALTADDVAELRAIMPDDRLHIVDNRDMPDVCLQHLLAIALIDGTVGFAAAHDRARMADPAILALRSRMKAIPSKDLTEARPPRQAIIEIDTKDGRSLRHHTRAVLGTPANPMTRAQVVAKARDLIEPDLGPALTGALIDAILQIDRLPDIRALRPLLGAAG